MAKNYERIEGSQSVGKKGGLGRWESLTDEAPEFWSGRAVRSQSFRELYPKKDGETAKEYAERLIGLGVKTLHPKEELLVSDRWPGESNTDYTKRKDDEYAEKIQELTEKELAAISGDKAELRRFMREIDIYRNDELRSRNGHYYYGKTTENGEPITQDEDGRPNKSAVYGYDFREAGTSLLPRSEYEKIFPVDRGTAELKKFVAARASDARQEKLLDYKIRTQADEERAEMARFYVGALYYGDAYEGKGLFEGLGDKDYSEDDRRFVQRRRLEERQSARTLPALQAAGKRLEAFMYPAINLEEGFLSLPNRSAAPVPVSEYDDKKHATDVAAMVPLETVGEDGEAGAIEQFAAFDLTTGTGEQKLLRIASEFRDHHGLTALKYPYSCQKELLPEMIEVPHFVICLPRHAQENFEMATVKSEPPTAEIQALIDYQILRQAEAWTVYWARRDGVKKGIFEDFYNTFLKKFKANHVPIENVIKKYPGATNYLSLLKKAMSTPQRKIEL